MNTDIRLSVRFFGHFKTLELERRCGKEGIVCLLKLWVWAAVNRPSGDLSGLYSEVLEMCSGWTGEKGDFCRVLRELGWLDGEDGKFMLHGWDEFQLWAKKAESRENIGRLGQLARKNIMAYKRLQALGVKGIDTALYAALTGPRWEECIQNLSSNWASPTPSPTPTPAPKRKQREAEKPKDEKPKTDFERKWDGDPTIKKFNPLDYIKKIQEIAANTPKLPERKPGLDPVRSKIPETGLESEVNTNGKDNEENDERRRAVG